MRATVANGVPQDLAHRDLGLDCDDVMLQALQLGGDLINWHGEGDLVDHLTSSRLPAFTTDEASLVNSS